jgi:hypothetical protein
VDLRKYFRRVREIESELLEAYHIIVSLETPDGGKAGIMSEVPRALAAKAIAEGRAVLASEAEREAFQTKQLEARVAAERAELARRVQVIVTDSEPAAANIRKK